MPASISRFRILAENLVGKDNLMALDGAGLGIYPRALLRRKQELLLALFKQAQGRSIQLCPFAQVAGVVDYEPSIPFPMPGLAHKNVICRHFRRRVTSKSFAANKKSPVARSVWRNRKRANVCFVCEAHDCPFKWK